MPTIKWSEYLTGDDSTGDGTSGNPYKTITKASIGLSGGDEVRVGKGPADAALTGTLGFTTGDKALVGTGTLFTSELAIGDFVKGGDGHWWEVITITSDVLAALFQVYAGNTESGISSYKLGVISTGEAASAATVIQAVSVSGSSEASRLKISGGWDLTTELQTGESFFRQMHGTFATRYGRGLYMNSKSYIEVENLHFLRYDNCYYMTNCSSIRVTGLLAISAGDEGIYFSSSRNCEFVSCIASGCVDKGLYMTSSHSNQFDDCEFYSNPTTGVSLIASHANVFRNPIVKRCQSGFYIQRTRAVRIIGYLGEENYVGVYVQDCGSNEIAMVTLNDSHYGLSIDLSLGLKVSGYSATGNNTEVSVLAGKTWAETPVVGIQSFKAVGDDRQYFEYGMTYRDTTDARSGACLKFDPSSAIYYIRQSFFCKAESGIAQTVKLYMKDDSSFNGDVVAALYFLGERITGWSTWTMTTSYVEQSIVGALGDITEDGMLELRVKVRGTAGNVFADDFSYS